MLKLVTLIPRKPGTTREQFIDHYENRHVPLIEANFSQFCRYVRNYPTSGNLHYAGVTAVPDAPFDAVTEHWFESQADFDAMMAQFAGDPELARQVAEDEERFCDTARMVMFMVEERESTL
jgi:uncharacterized protein (TIGR02118 family)